MNHNTKRELILDAMQNLMNGGNAQSVSVSDIAREAGIGKGSIYYYFKSKEDILEAVIERSYSDAIDQAKKLVEADGLDALTKMEIIFRTCRDSSIELLRQESNNYFELQQSALLHQEFIHVTLKNLCPILADIIRQGNEEGTMCCKAPEEASRIVLIILTVMLDNHINQGDRDQVRRTLDVFAYMLENSFQIEKGKLSYLWSQ